LSGRYARFGRILTGDSIECLKRVERIDLFVQDSDHSADYEAREYETIESRLCEGAVVLSDNAHVTDALLQFGRRTGRRYLFFAERPANHWYRGSGIGALFS
jgi:predicted O-methyltransferase YrrM